MNHHRPDNRHSFRVAIAGLLAASVASACLVGCESPLRPGDDLGGDGYSESVLVRDLIRSGALDDMAAAPTINQGIEEARIDSPGPATGPATEPAPTEASIAAVSVIGLPEAALNLPEPQVRMSLQDVIARTVGHSLAIKVDAYNPGISEAALIQAEAAFDPVIFGQSQWSEFDEPASPIPSVTNGQSWQNQIGVRDLLPSGATISAYAQTTYHDLQLPPNTPENLNYVSALNLTIDQPLLRGFGSDYNQANIYLAQRDLRISRADFKKTVIQNVGDAEEAYQNLILARTLVEINMRLVIASRQTYQIVYLRRGLDVTEESINLILTALRQREETLLIAQENYRLASDKLKSLMNDPAISTRSNTLIDPIDRPTTEPFNYSTEETILQALQQRPEMEEARLKLEQADIVVRVSKNDLLPRLDLMAGMQSNAIDPGLERSFARTISPANSIDWNAGVHLEFPLGNRAAESAYVANQLKQRQAIESMMENADTIVEDVKSKLHNVLTDYADIQMLDGVRQSAAATVKGNLDLDPIRPKTPEALQTKLQEQQALASAESALATAIVNYNIAIEQLERAKGTLLDFDHISLNHPPLAKPSSKFNNWFFNGLSIMPFPNK